MLFFGNSGTTPNFSLILFTQKFLFSLLFLTCICKY